MSLCAEERRKCLRSTEGKSESKRWHVEHREGGGGGAHNGIGMSDCYNSLADDYADIAEVARDVMLCWELGEVRCKEGS